MRVPNCPPHDFRLYAAKVGDVVEYLVGVGACRGSIPLLHFFEFEDELKHVRHARAELYGFPAFKTFGSPCTVGDGG